MRRVNVPAIVDLEVLELVAQRPDVDAAVGPLLPSIRQRYVDYVACHGNPWHISQDDAYRPIRPYFNNAYEGERPPLDFIATLRAWNEGACPMCGGSGTGTLDHYLPKAAFPEFSFFAPNLIPACRTCNHKRGARFRGGAADARPLQPYYDDIPALRMLHVVIEAPFTAPSFRFVLENVPQALHAAAAWHLENIILRAGLRRHCEQRWERLTKKPHRYLRNAGDVATARHNLAEIADEAADKDASYNCWDSLFFSGVARSDAIEYLLQIQTERD